MIKIKPSDWATPKYWLHLGVIAFVVLGILQLWTGGEMLTLTAWIWSIPLIGFGDIIAHTILKME